MESPAAAAAAGPRVYVPISHPDSPVPTYAVLQFLGISHPPDPSQPAILHAPSMHLLPCASSVSNPPSPAPKRCASSTESSNSSSSDEKDRKLTSIKPSPMKKCASGGALASSALSPVQRRNSKVLPLGPTVSITHTDKDTIIHTHSSNFREVVHQLTGATSGDKGLLPVTLPARTTTTTIRSGASNERDFTLPSATASPRAIIQNGVDNMEAANVRKPIGNPTTKLLERRKSTKVLERLSTSCRNLPPLMPSPVTPLASDFEKICLPVTPTTSEGSLTPHLNAVVNSTTLSQDAKAMEFLSVSGAIPSQERKPSLLQSRSAKAMPVDAIDVQGPGTPHLIHSQSLSLARSLSHASGMQSPTPLAVMDSVGPSLVLATGVGDLSLPEAMDVQMGEEQRAHDKMDVESAGVQVSSSNGRASSIAHDEESVIAKKGFFFHSQRPRYGDPTLLSLFPESPREL